MSHKGCYRKYFDCEDHDCPHYGECAYWDSQKEPKFVDLKRKIKINPGWMR